jgi:hypothetical protein
MFRVRKAKINTIAGQVSTGAKLATTTVKICPDCGHGHENPLQERCELCDTTLDADTQVGELYKIETVETSPAERISINDEERQRIGYELHTMFQVTKTEFEESEITHNGKLIGTLLYAPAAKISRINYGWKRRKDKQQKGFYIDPLSGKWSKDDSGDPDYDSNDDEESANRRHTQRIVPYVEDYKNILIFKPNDKFDNNIDNIGVMATLQIALKRGIERHYEIEEAEIAAEPLPASDKRNSILFYESSEGGAGVLNRMAGEETELSIIAKNALSVMHYDTSKNINTAADLEDTEKDLDNKCVAACYNCLLSYYNQSEHSLIDRRNTQVLEILVALVNGTVNKKMKYETPKCVVNYPINNGVWIADEYYENEKKVVFYEHPGKEAEDYIINRGYKLVIGKKE